MRSWPTEIALRCGLLGAGALLAACASSAPSAAPASAPAPGAGVWIVPPSPTAAAGAWTPLATRTAGPGRSLSLHGVYAGMSAEELRAHLGAEESSRDHDEAASWWQSAGHQPERELPFLIGFDRVLFINLERSDHQRPAWYAYLQNDRVVLLKASIYDDTTDPELKARFGFAPACFIGAPAEGVGETFGQADLVRPTTSDRSEHFYLRRGLSVLTGNGRIQVLTLFAPLPDRRVKEVAEGLGR